MAELISGILLAGGKSERIGHDKRYLEYGGSTLLDISLERLRSVTDEVILVAGRNEKIVFDDVISINDIINQRGPLVGIYSGLKKMRNSYGLINPVDTPNITEDFLLYMQEKADGYDIVIPEWRRGLEPLLGIYSKNVIPVVDKFLENNIKLAPHLLVTQETALKIKIIPENEISMFGDPEFLFKNINTLNDLKSPSS